MCLLEFKVKPDFASEMTGYLASMLPTTRKFEGCEVINMYVDDDDPTIFISYQQWESREHQEKYVAFRAAQGDLEKLSSMIISPPTPRYFNLVNV
jgi:quinol monooxygenase YgiN